jgi:hypothetical protein
MILFSIGGDGSNQMYSTCLCAGTCRNSAEQFASRACLGWRPQLDAEGKSFGPYTFMTYKEAWDKAVKVSTDGSSNQPTAATAWVYRQQSGCCSVG